MQAGKLRHLVTFSRPMDDSGEATDNPGRWKSVKTVNADIRPVSIREIEAAQGLLMQTDIAVECRWLAELAAMDNRWLAESTVLAEPCRVITAHNPDFRHRVWRVVCRAQSLCDGEYQDAR